jgi:hypothetical protein
MYFVVFTTYQQYTRIAKLFLKPINNMREFGTVVRTYSKVTVQCSVSKHEALHD